MSELLRRFIACVSRLVPAWGRREFRAEWEAELANAWVEPSTPRSWRERRRVARRALGAVPDAWYLFRQQWRPEMILQDIRFAIRLMRLRAGYTAIVIVTLALSIGATTGDVQRDSCRIAPAAAVQEPSRLVKVWENDRLNGKPRYSVAPANYDDWRNQTRTFEQLAAYITQGGSLAGSVRRAVPRERRRRDAELLRDARRDAGARAAVDGRGRCPAEQSHPRSSATPSGRRTSDPIEA